MWKDHVILEIVLELEKGKKWWKEMVAALKLLLFDGKTPQNGSILTENRPIFDDLTANRKPFKPV